MTRSTLAAIFIAATVVAIPHPLPVWAQEKSDLAGRWTLNRALSQFPPDVGFGLEPLSADADTAASSARGRRGSGGRGLGALASPGESEDDAKRLKQLTAEVRTPSTHLTIDETATAVTIAGDQGPSRTFYPDGRARVVQLDGDVPAGVTAKREAGRLVVLYSVEEGRELRYTYSRGVNPPQLVVDVQFVERGGGDRIRRIYEPTSPTEIVAAAPAAPASTRAPTSSSPATPATSSTDRPQGQTFNQQPDAELKGLTTLGLVVEDLSPQAAVCGLSQSALETAVSKRLSDAGFKVVRNSDEDTYLYIDVVTTSLSTGLCVSRYDAFLYTHTMAKLSYQQAPVLVQVSLLHKGGLAGGASAAHASAVLRGLQEYADQFSTRIRDANKGDK